MTCTDGTHNYFAGFNWSKDDVSQSYETSHSSTDKSDDAGERRFDPFRVFEVRHEKCYILDITVLFGTKISKGRFADWFDTPDPYVVLQILGTANGQKKTQHVNNCSEPEWNQKFRFYIDPAADNVLKIVLMDANYIVDDTLGWEKFHLSELTLDEKTEKTFVFNEVSKVFTTMILTESTTPDLRYSLALCKEEKKFLKQRRQRVFKAMQNLLDDQGPRSLKQVPTIAVLGSGGGFRALTAYGGVFKALSDTGILDCTTYVAGLSGSAWYLSTLYSHPDFPEKSPGELLSELRSNITNNWARLLNPLNMYGYITTILDKSVNGQPISFTDFFGHLLGDTLLNERKDAKLTDQVKILEDGKVPLPLYTCLHVKRNVSARVFQEWIEFSPYEIGIAKYGVFMKPSLFGSKFFIGHALDIFPEPNLHYLQGVWGSAFTILFKRLVQAKGKKDLAEMMRDKIGEEEEEEELRRLENIMDDTEVEDNNESGTSDEEVDERVTDSAETPHCGQQPRAEGGKTESVTGDETETQLEGSTSPAAATEQKGLGLNLENKDVKKKDLMLKKGEGWKERRQSKKQRKKKMQQSFWERSLKNIFSSSILDTRAGRAGIIYNPLRGLSLRQTFPFSPFSPTTAEDDADFKGHFEALQTNAKKLYLVDGGLTFNSPFPLVLRPQRAVDLYLSFDFSARKTDDAAPFKELLLAEKWARMNNVSFPPVEQQVEEYLKEPVKECYIFRDSCDPYCPVILHFVIINRRFKEYKYPGVPRELAEEKEAASFSIFSDSDNPYSLFNFNYSYLQFDRLTQLMEFNTIDSLSLIKEEMIKAVQRKTDFPRQAPISLANISKLTLKFRNKTSENRLKDYVRILSVGNQSEADEYFNAEEENDDLSSSSDA